MTRPPRRVRRGVATAVAIVGLALSGVAIAACDADAPTTGAPKGSVSPSTTAAPPGNVYAAACAGVLVASSPGSIASDEIDELSGIAASRRNPGVWWVHNDSGDSARVFAIGDDGRNLGAFTFAGATATDWEDIAVGPGPDASTSYLYVADIGDNPFEPERRSVSILRVPEPAVDAARQNPPPQTISGVARLIFTYPDGPHDAETLLVDPRSGELYIVTKSLTGVARVFRAAGDLAPGSTTRLVEVATLSVLLVTGGDVSPAGDVVALRTDGIVGNGSVLVYPRNTTSLADAFAEAPCRGATGDEPQGEAIGFTSDGRGYVTVSEGVRSPVHRFEVP